MDEEFETKYGKTYSNAQQNITIKPRNCNEMDSNTISPTKEESLTTKKAVELLLAGTLKYKVCRYCLTVTSSLSELDQILHVAGKGTLHKITIRDMVASFYPFKVVDDPNLPNKICNKCLNQTMRAYFFAQQCEQTERALHNCFDDIYDKLEKLDPLERPKKRGRQKQNPNHNVIHAEHENVIDYAEPIINLINTGSVLLDNDSEEAEIDKLKCPRCWLVLPNLESLLNHEKMHPKTMWYHCQACGNSYAKKTHLNRHIKKVHILGDDVSLPANNNQGFQCMECGNSCENYNQHLQHIEKHKFKMVLDYLVNKKMDKLCAVCLDKSVKMVDLEKTVCLHGGYPEISGNKSLYNILGSTIPEMNFQYNYTGTKICEKCLNHALISYIFIHRTYSVRNRLSTCVSLFLENLSKINEENGNVFVEISQDIILPIREQNNFDEYLDYDETDEVDESELKVDILEDEFRIKSDSESESEPEITHNDKTYNDMKTERFPKINEKEFNDLLQEISNIDNALDKEKMNLNILNELDDSTDDFNALENPAKRVTRTYSNRKLVNGYQGKFGLNAGNAKCKSVDVCSEFLTFKKKKPIKMFYKYKYTCPLCNKYFVSAYHLKRHVLKHLTKKVQCKMCKKKFISKFYLYEHVKMIHLQKKNEFVPCMTCGRTFTDEDKLALHEKTHVAKQCLLCDKLFATQKHYDSHMQRHAAKLNIIHERKAQTCSFCEKEYSDDNLLSLHVNKVHLQIKPFACDMCDKQFYTEDDMNSHKIVHSLFSKEICQFCNKVLKSRRDLVIHVRRHIGVKPNHCQVCGQSFYSELAMKHHMLKCHGGRYPCKMCKTVFASKTGLKNHMDLVHSVF